ncbi:unnamed protein product [Paramecium octaurelia]|uniref:Uncharacterized protein n=1 Tax=Paramecium octaurelia TaxID=43137 RepID=A0A8S1VBE7_PAROT|nr:unnamed protein product [Paramecium octaurelia]
MIIIQSESKCEIVIIVSKFHIRAQLFNRHFNYFELTDQLKIEKRKLREYYLTLKFINNQILINYLLLDGLSNIYRLTRVRL